MYAQEGDSMFCTQGSSNKAEASSLVSSYQARKSDGLPCKAGRWEKLLQVRSDREKSTLEASVLLKSVK